MSLRVNRLFLFAKRWRDEAVREVATIQTPSRHLQEIDVEAERLFGRQEGDGDPPM